MVGWIYRRQAHSPLLLLFLSFHDLDGCVLISGGSTDDLNSRSPSKGGVRQSETGSVVVDGELVDLRWGRWDWPVRSARMLDGDGVVRGAYGWKRLVMWRARRSSPDRRCCSSSIRRRRWSGSNLRWLGYLGDGQPLLVVAVVVARRRRGVPSVGSLETDDHGWRRSPRSWQRWPVWSSMGTTRRDTKRVELSLHGERDAWRGHVCTVISLIVMNGGFTVAVKKNLKWFGGGDSVRGITVCL